MAITSLKTTIKLRYDTHKNWISNDPTLGAGEVAIATLESADSDITQVPSVLIKVGDGTKTYSALPFISAKAGDVYSWAKSATKPTYSAEEVTGLDTYISEHAASTDHKFKLAIEGYTLKLQIDDGKGGEFSDDPDNQVTIPKYDDTTIKASIEAKQDKITFNTAYDASSNKAATMADITTATAGLAGALHWKGTQEMLPDGDDKNTYKQGDVITVGTKEYAYDGETWQELGDEASHHTHSNKSVLDSITAEKVSSWDTAKTQSDQNKSDISDIRGQLEEFAAVDHTHDIKDLNQTVVLVLDCGDSTEPAVGAGA